MKGAMKGLADSLDPESAYLSPDLVRSLESNDTGRRTAEVGVDLTDSTTCVSSPSATVLPRRRLVCAPPTSFERSTIVPRAICRRTRARGGCVVHPDRRWRFL